MYKIWVGKRESDILTYKYFDYSITFYGSNNANNISFCSHNRIRDTYSKHFVEFVADNLKKLITHHKDVAIHFYNNTLAYKILDYNPEIQQYIVNVNSLSIQNLLRHKTLSRVWLSNYVDTPAFCLLSKNECTIQNLQNKFGNNYDSFIIQKNYSGGGLGTYLTNLNNEIQIQNVLSQTELYLVSPFYSPNKSLSCHVMIDNEKCVVFPISQQILYTKNNSMEYIGNTYLNASSGLADRVRGSASIIGKELQKLGYKGICGFDFIFTGNNILLIEINPRYQGSSYMINFVLNENGLPSLFELNTMCFCGIIPHDIAVKIKKLEVKYSNRYIKYQDENDINNTNRLLKSKKYILFTDGYENSKVIEKGCYLIKYISPADNDCLLM